MNDYQTRLLKFVLVTQVVAATALFLVAVTAPFIKSPTMPTSGFVAASLSYVLGFCGIAWIAFQWGHFRGADLADKLIDQNRALRYLLQSMKPCCAKCDFQELMENYEEAGLGPGERPWHLQSSKDFAAKYKETLAEVDSIRKERGPITFQFIPKFHYTRSAENDHTV